MELAPGDRFDRYTIEGLLGQGGMGRVYKARDAKLQRPVALKLLRLDAISDGEGDVRARGSARLLREARAAAALDHVNAIAIHDVGEVDGVPFIAMELVDGTPLRAYVGDDNVALETKLRWLVDVARALSAAHARGLIHRDIKPENVMVRRDGLVKVLDFGIARAERAGDEAEAIAPGQAALQTADAWATMESALVGTPRYMAPEQLRGDKLDARSDQFSWGVLAFELLTGHPPWGASATVSLTLVSSILSDEPVATDALFAKCPEHVANIVLRALSKNRDERFASMDEIVAALERGEAALRAAPPSSNEFAKASTGTTVKGPAARARERRRALFGAAALAVVASVGVLAFLRARSTSSSAQQGAAQVAPPAAPSVVRLTDLPIPSSEIADAKAAYVAGIHALRDASIVPAVRHFAKATQLDPSMAAAHLRLITHGRAVSETDEQAHFAKARELHALLTPRDQALLAAIEPSFLTMPPDETEVTKRLRDLAARYPLDAEFAYLAAAREPDPTKAAPLYEHVLELDPEFALALWRKANSHLLVSDFPSTLAALDRCITLVPSSTSCLTVRALVDEELGRCVEMEKDVRTLEYVSPSPRTHDLIARVLYANGAPMTAVKEALGRKWATAAAEQRDSYELDDNEHLAILEGDFAAAEKMARGAVKHIEQSASEEDHKNTMMPLVDLLDEMGDTANAARLAEQYLTARAAWKPIGAWSPVPKMFGFAVRGKLRSERDRSEALAKWRKLWDDADPNFRPQWWVLGYAIPAEDEADAKAALAIAPTPLPRVHTNQFHREGFASVGKVLLLAGRADEALPLLRAAAATCSALQAPIDHTRAQLYLGQALEQTGHADEACAPYKVVLARWGNAKPRSVTADRARARAAALKCK